MVEKEMEIKIYRGGEKKRKPTNDQDNISDSPSTLMNNTH